jgi:hypothetical protein
MLKLRRAYYLAAMIGFAHSAGAANLVKDGGFETPATPPGSYTLYDLGDKIGPWTVVGANGNVNTISTTFTQNGYTFGAKRGEASMDLTGTSNTATGVAQQVKTAAGVKYTLTFWVGNVYDPNGIFGVSSTVNVYSGSTLLISAKNTKGKGKTSQIWQKFSTTFVASGPTMLSFVNGDPSDDTLCGLDQITLAPYASQ